MTWTEGLHLVDIGFTCFELDSREKIACIFGKDKILQNRFLEFWAKGFKGITWGKENEWISYAWMSLPETFGPPHLPRHIQRLPVYWIFYCRTKEEYRGRGLYKASLSILCHWARERDPKAEIYIDTEPDNLPSRKAVEDVGFLPAGIITTWTLNLPKLRWIIIRGQWNKDADHSEVFLR